MATIADMTNAFSSPSADTFKCRLITAPPVYPYDITTIVEPIFAGYAPSLLTALQTATDTETNTYYVSGSCNFTFLGGEFYANLWGLVITINTTPETVVDRLPFSSIGGGNLTIGTTSFSLTVGVSIPT